MTIINKQDHPILKRHNLGLIVNLNNNMYYEVNSYVIVSTFSVFCVVPVSSCTVKPNTID